MTPCQQPVARPSYMSQMILNNQESGESRGDLQQKLYTFQFTYLLGGQCKIALDRVRLSISQDHRSIYLRLWSVGNRGSLWRRLQRERRENCFVN